MEAKIRITFNANPYLRVCVTFFMTYMSVRFRPLSIELSVRHAPSVLVFTASFQVEWFMWVGWVHQVSVTVTHSTTSTLPGSGTEDYYVRLLK